MSEVAEIEELAESVVDLRLHGRGPHQNRAKTKCKRGHPFTPENTRITSRGYRACRACARLAQREFTSRLRQQGLSRPRYQRSPASRAAIRAYKVEWSRRKRARLAQSDPFYGLKRAQLIEQIKELRAELARHGGAAK